MDHTVKRAALVVLLALAPATFAQTINVRVVVFERYSVTGDVEQARGARAPPWSLETCTPEGLHPKTAP